MATGEPVWDLARRFPLQGAWTEEDYLRLEARLPRIEFCDGALDALPIPSDRHQALLTALLMVLREYARRTGGLARPAGVRLRLRAGQFREPDLALVTAVHRDLRGDEFWTGADLVVEIVSGGPDDQARDRVVKRREYALARIPEYWLVDPDAEAITVLRLDGDRYREHGVFVRGATLESPTLAGLTVDATSVFDDE